jgi:hypothetical protein
VIVRISADLMEAILGVEPAIRMSRHPGEFIRKNPARDVAGLVPPWLSEMACGGSMLVISNEDYDDIPLEVRGFVDVVKR